MTIFLWIMHFDYDHFSLDFLISNSSSSTFMVCVCVCMCLGTMDAVEGQETKLYFIFPQRS